MSRLTLFLAFVSMAWLLSAQTTAVWQIGEDIQIIPVKEKCVDSSLLHGI
ncbi:MAG: hypothetical protein R2795_24150 [Saprospiraceae bacterium]